MIDLIWDLFQQGQIKTLQEGKLSQLERERAQDTKAEDLADRLAQLEQKHEQLKLVTLAFWSLLRDHTGLREADLRKYVEQFDLLDGKRDGVASSLAERVKCTGCERTVLSTSAACVYCGAKLARTRLF